MADPYEQAFAELGQALVDLDGDGRPDVAVPTVPRRSAKIQAYTMRGREPPAELMAARNLPTSVEESKATEEGIARGLAELTGIPGMVRGAGNIQRGYEEGDPLRAVGGAGQMALGAVPMASMTSKGLAALSPFFSSAPRAAGTLAATTVPIGAADDAAAGTANAATAVAQDPEVARLRAEIAAAEKERISIGTTPIKGMNAAGAEAARTRGDAAIGQRLERLSKDLEAAELRARDMYFQNAPFRERNPGLAELFMAGGLGVAGAVPFLNTTKARLADLAISSPRMKATADAAETAFTKGNAVQAAQKQAELGQRMQSWEAGASPNYVGAGVKGALIGAEASALPDQIDYISLGPDSPAGKKAAEKFQSSDYYMGRIAPALLGAGAATAGNSLATLVPRGAPDLPRFQEIRSRGANGTSEGIKQAQTYIDAARAARQPKKSGAQGSGPADREALPLPDQAGGGRELQQAGRQSNQPSREPTRRNDQNSGSSRSSLSDPDRIDIQEKLLGGKSTAEIATEYGVKESSLKGIAQKTEELLKQAGGDRARALADLQVYRKQRDYSYAIPAAIGASAMAQEDNPLLSLFGGAP